MTTTTVPQDLLDWRAEGMLITGLDPVNFGIAPDASHKSGGGYHCGVQDIKDIGRYPDGDYSTRQERDRIGGNVACASDPGDDWPHGGRAAWLRFNNLLVHQMMAGIPALAALRAVNFSPDGTATKRYDSLYPDAGVIDSTDSVYMHTHLEFWRNTEGKRAQCLAKILAIMRAAVANTSLEDDMDQKELVAGTATPQATAGRNIGQVFGDAENRRNVEYGEIKPGDTRYPPTGSPLFKALAMPDQVTALIAKVDALAADIAAIQAGQIDQDALNAAMVAALQTPAVQAVLVAASKTGADLAEDS